MKCPRCGKENIEGAVFCIYCGAPLIQKPRKKWVGERKLVTILFVDIVDFTSLSEDLDPEEVLNILNELFAKLKEPVEKYDGTVDKYIGDAMMVLFGAPNAHENDPERAVSAALEMQKIARDFSRNIDRPISISIGINTGIVVTARIGADKEAPYSVIGDAVNVAKRLQEYAEPGEILVSETVYNFTSYLFEFEEIGEVKVKGRKKPVRVYKVLNHKRFAGPEAYLRGKLLELIGRQKELNEILERKEIAFKKGIGQVVVISGELGIGKSRLKYEIKHKISSKEAFILETRTAPHTRHIAYWPFIQLIREIFNIEEFDKREVLLKKLEEGQERLKLDGITIKLIKQLLGVAKLDASEYKQIKYAVKSLIEALSHQKPVLLIFEDVHWMDPSSLEIISFLASEIKTMRVLMVIITRSGFLPDLPVSYNLLHLFLRPLSPSESEEFVKALLGIDKVPEEFFKEFFRKTEGNPFYMEQLIFHLLSQGYIEIKDRELIIKKDLKNQNLPLGLQNIIAAQIDNLPVELKELVKKASVIGREFNIQILKRLVNMENIEAMLLMLSNYGIIYKHRNSPDTYIFKHSLVRDVAYEMVLKSEKRALHTRVAYIIEEMYSDRLEEYYELIAYHFLEGEAYYKAVNYLLKSAERDIQLHLFKSALNKYEKLLQIVEELEDEKSILSPNMLYRIWYGKGRTDEYLGNLDSAERSFTTAYDIAQEAENAYGMIDAINRIAKVLFAKGFVNKAFQKAIEAKEFSEKLAYTHGLVEAYETIADINFLKGITHGAVDLINKAINLIENIKDKAKLIELLLKRNTYCLTLGKVEIAQASLKKAEELAKELNDTYLLVRIEGEQASLKLLKNEIETAKGLLKRSIKQMQKFGDLEGESHLLEILAEAYLKEAEYGEALSALRKALEIYGRLKIKKSQARVMSKIAEVLFYYIGDKDDSLSYLEECIRLQKEMDSLQELTISYLRLVDIYYHNGDYELALKYSEEALKLIEASGIKHLYLKALLRNLLTLFVKGEYVKSFEKFKYATQLFKDPSIPYTTRMEFYKIGMLVNTLAGKYNITEALIKRFEKEKPNSGIFYTSALTEKLRYLLLRDRIKEAAYIIPKLFEKVSKYENKELYSTLLVMKGYIQKDYELGREMMEEGIAIGFIFLSPMDIALSEILYAKAALKQNDRETFLHHLDSAYNIAEEYNILPIKNFLKGFAQEGQNVDILS